MDHKDSNDQQSSSYEPIDFQPQVEVAGSFSSDLQMLDKDNLKDAEQAEQSSNSKKRILFQQSSVQNNHARTQEVVRVDAEDLNFDRSSDETPKKTQETKVKTDESKMKLKFAIEDSDEIDSMESENLNVKPVSMMKKHSSTPAPKTAKQQQNYRQTRQETVNKLTNLGNMNISSVDHSKKKDDKGFLSNMGSIIQGNVGGMLQELKPQFDKKERIKRQMLRQKSMMKDNIPIAINKQVDDNNSQDATSWQPITPRGTSKVSQETNTGQQGQKSIKRREKRRTSILERHAQSRQFKKLVRYTENSLGMSGKSQDSTVSDPVFISQNSVILDIRNQFSDSRNKKLMSYDEKSLNHLMQFERSFFNLTTQDGVCTNRLDVIYAMINTTGEYLITLLKDHGQFSTMTIKTFDLRKAGEVDVVNSFVIIGESEQGQTYMRGHKIVENKEGTTFAIAYFDQARFKIRVFDIGNPEVQQIDEINELLGIDRKSVPTPGTLFPNITVEFHDDRHLFVNIFYTFNQSNYNFYYDFINNKMVGSFQKTQLKSKPENFIVGLLQNETTREYYAAYRHGHFVSMKFKDLQQEGQEEKPTPAKVQMLPGRGYGRTRLIKDQLIVSKASKSTQVFKILDTQSDKRVVLHQNLQNLGALFYNESTETLIITQIEKILFYRINEETLKLEIEVQMLNFMHSSVFIQGPDNNLAITYSVNQQDLVVHRKKENHKFKIQLQENDEVIRGGIELKNYRRFLLYNNDYLKGYCSKNFKQIGSNLNIFENNQTKKVSKTWGIQDSRIIGIKASRSEDHLAVFTGIKTIDGLVDVHGLYVYELNLDMRVEQPFGISLKQSMKYEKSESESKSSSQSSLCLADDGNFLTLKSQLDLTKKDSKLKNDIGQISIFCEFKNKDEDLLFLIDQESIYVFNHVKQELQQIHKFSGKLLVQPDALTLNSTQSVAFVSAGKDSLFVKLNEEEAQREVDFDFKNEVFDIQASLSANGKFYLLANRYKRCKGVFLIELDQDDPCDDDIEEENERQVKFLLVRNTQLDISNANMYILNQQKRLTECNYTKAGKMRHSITEIKSQKSQSKELIISYKKNDNTYIIYLINLENGLIIFKYEKVHMWENSVSGLLLSSSKFLIITKDSFEIIGLNSKWNKQFQAEEKGTLSVLHCLQECQYLKINDTDMLCFHETTNETDEQILEITIEDQWRDPQIEENMFEPLYKVQVESFDLTEMLLLQSLYSSSTATQMAKIIEDQPDPKLFFKCTLELNLSNIISIFSLDRRIVQAILHEKHSDHFSYEYPIFFNLRHFEDDENFNVRSALDIALQSNQIIAAQEIMMYIVKYQNSPVFSFIFKNKLTMLIDMEINICPLLNSKIVFFECSYENWPQTHSNDETLTKPYNQPFNQLKFQYESIFSAHRREESNQKKVKYTVNLLPSLIDKDDVVCLMEQLSVTPIPLYGIFECESLKNLIEFKWKSYAKWVHYGMFLNNIVYVFMIFYFINHKYNNVLEMDHTSEAVLCVVCVNNSILFLYELWQLLKQTSLEYLNDRWNIADLVLIIVGYINVYMQFTRTDVDAHTDDVCQITMIFVTIFLLIKTFFYLRIFPQLNELVIMIQRVMFDLSTFVMFFMMLLIFCSLILSIIGFGNFDHTEDETVLAALEKRDEGSSSWPGSEYRKIPFWLHNILTILRFSLGDFQFGAVNYLDQSQAYIFWVMWVLIVLITCIIFLNFIIAEVSQSYQLVTDSVEQLIMLEKVKLIDESEQMLFKDPQNLPLKYFPNYLIIRQKDE